MANIVCYDSDGQTLDHYTQWDTGQKLIIRGADTSTAPDFHFLNAHITTAYVVKSEISGTSITVEIPDFLLQFDVPLIIYAYYEPGTTEFSLRIPIKPRSKPSDYVYVDPDLGSTGGGSSSGSSISIADNLTTNSANTALSAAQGVVIKTMIDSLNENKLDSTELSVSVESALRQAKESGDFDGEDGLPGRGIVSIVRTGGTGAAGSTDTYTITYTDDTTSSFYVYNGANGVTTGGDGSGTTIAGENGATFTPFVDSSGNLSWSNDKGLANPLTVNIKGDPGSPGRGITSITRTVGTGAPGTVDTYTISYTDSTTSTFDVYNGADGTLDGGSSGEDGATFTPSVDSLGNLSWTNDKGLENPVSVNIKGTPGETPVRGVNYWTEDDIAEIRSYVDDAILGGAW